MQYFELYCKSNFSFLEGASHADELVERATELGYAGLAITDRNTLAGVVRGHTAAKDSNLPFFVGCELRPIDGPPLVVWPQDRAAYGRLCRLLTSGRVRAKKGACLLRWSDIAAHCGGIFAGLVLSQPTIANQKSVAELLQGEWYGDEKFEVQRNLPDAHFDPQDDAAWLKWLRLFKDHFGDRASLIVSPHTNIDDRQLLARHAWLGEQARLPLLAAGNVQYHLAERMILHDVIAAIRQRTTVDKVVSGRPPNSQFHLRSIEQLRSVYREHPQAIRRTVAIAEACKFSLVDLKYEYPTEWAPDGSTPLEYLKQLTWQGAKQRYPQGVPDKVLAMLKHEFELIGELHYEAYFLTVWDLVRFARSRGILCQGRGSAANSSVCFCLGVTSVDPNEMDMLFERFMSRERNEAPDIDVDFEHQRREEVLQYIYEKYGRQRAGMTAAIVTYRTRSAVRECGKALGISLDRIDALSKIVDSRSNEDSIPNRFAHVGIDPQSDIGQRYLYAVEHLIGFPRHLSQHVGGMVMTQGPLCELCPIENAAMDGRTVIQWDKDDLDTLGILKVDCLSLGMLSAIHRSFDLLEKHFKRHLTLANIPQGDSDVYDMICKADTIGVFQIESRAQMSMLPRLKPRCYYDLVVEVAIVRPGPIQGQMVHPYLQARQSGIQPDYPTQAIRDTLAKTLGVPIFQEQAMKLAVVAAGFTPGEADQLRRAMAAWRRPGIIDRFHRKLIDGMLAKGLSQEFAEHVFTQIRGFGEYGFPESHAASFALLVYVSCWLKHHYPEVFCAALLNSQPLGFYAPAQLIQDARQHGVVVQPIDINHSEWECSLHSIRHGYQRKPGGRPADEHFALRLGLRMVRGLRQQEAEVIVEQRKRQGAFADLSDLVRRTSASQATISCLADAGALNAIAGHRRAALWQALAQESSGVTPPLLQASDVDDDVPNELQAMQKIEEVYADYNTTGVSLRGHPIQFCRPELAKRRVRLASDLPNLRHGQFVRVAGLVLLRQRPSTAKGITFVTLEDETGSINLIFHVQVWSNFSTICRTSNAWIVHGVLENRENVIHVVVGRVEDLSPQIAGLLTRSRDFQ